MVAAHLRKFSALSCRTCEMRGHQSSNCWLGFELRGFYNEDNVRNAWGCFKQIQIFNRKLKL